MPESSQGSTVTFDGNPIGMLRSWRVGSHTAVFEEVTNLSCPVLGEGLNTRVVKLYDCTSIEPGTLELSILGVPPYISDDIGVRATLEVTFENGYVTGEAMLENFEISANLGEWLNGTARFRWTGAPPAS